MHKTREVMNNKKTRVAKWEEGHEDPQTQRVMSEYVVKHRMGVFPCYTLTLVTAYASEHIVYTVVYSFLDTSLHFDSQGYPPQKPISVCDPQTHKSMDKKKLTDINLHHLQMLIYTSKKLLLKWFWPHWYPGSSPWTTEISGEASMPRPSLDRHRLAVHVQHSKVELLRHVSFRLRSNVSKAGTLRAFFRSASRASEILPRHLRVVWDTKFFERRWVWPPYSLAPVLANYTLCYSGWQSALCPCKRCSANMDGCTAVIADAAQFYEKVSQDEIDKAQRWVTRRAKILNVHVVTGFHGKRLRGFASTHRHTRVKTVDVWTPRQIELALLLTLSQIYFSVSCERWRQRRGVPIDGMVSKPMCSVIMFASEIQWSEDLQRRRPPGSAEEMTSQTFVTRTTQSH